MAAYQTKISCNRPKNKEAAGRRRYAASAVAARQINVTSGREQKAEATVDESLMWK